MAYIYCITNNINGKQYVGKTNFSIERRWKEHCKDAKRERCEKRPLYSAINKYGKDNFTVSLLEECSAEDSAKREEYWIDKLNTYGSSGYNATRGGDSKKYYNYEELAQSYVELGTVQAVTEKYHCDKATVKVACAENNVEIASGQEINKRTRSMPVIMLDITGNEELMTFDSLHDAERYLKKKSAGHHISEVCRGIRKIAYGYKWKFKE